MAYSFRLSALGAPATPAHLALPAFTRAISIMAPLARMVRASTLETLVSDYMKVAWAPPPPAAFWTRSLMRTASG